MTHEDQRQDLELARKAAAGDQDAWREIFEASNQPLFNFLCYQVGSREEARDLLQETFLAGWRSLDRYRGDGSLLSWLRTIALRKSMDWKRRLMSRLSRLTALARETEAWVPPDTDAAMEMTTPAFRRALSCLSPRQRACLLLHELEDLPFREVAAQVGCGEGTARVHHHRACKKMRALLAAEPAKLVEGMGGQQA